MKRLISVDNPIFEGASLDCYFECLYKKGIYYFHLWPKSFKILTDTQIRQKDGQIKKMGDTVGGSRNNGIVVTSTTYFKYEEVLGRILVTNKLLSEKSIKKLSKKIVDEVL